MGIKPKVTNTYLNTAAQVVEIVHCAEDAITVIDQLLERGSVLSRWLRCKECPGEGVGVCEVPRGMLIHDYAIGEDGKMTGANCIIPTNQNIGNLQADFRARVPQISDRPVDEMTPGPGDAGQSL